MKIKLTAEEVADLDEAERDEWVQPEGADYFIPRAVHEYAEDRAERVHKTVKALREELKTAAKPEELTRLQREIALRDAIEAAGGNRYARAFFADRVDVDDDGAFVLKGENGRIMRDDSEQPLALADALRTIRDSGEHGTLFNARSSGKTGGGAPRGESTTPAPRTRASTMTPEERRDFMREQMGKGKTAREAITMLEQMG